MGLEGGNLLSYLQLTSTTKYRLSYRSLHQVMSGQSAACCGSVWEQSTQLCGRVPLTIIVLLYPSITQAEKPDFFILSCLSKLYRSSEFSEASVFYFLLEQAVFTSVWIKMSTFFSFFGGGGGGEGGNKVNKHDQTLPGKFWTKCFWMKTMIMTRLWHFALSYN